MTTREQMKPTVLVTVEGGIAYAEVVAGDVDIIQYDWDTVDEGDEFDIERAIEEAQRLPDDWPEKSDILRQMMERYEDVSGSPYQPDEEVQE